MEGPGAIRINPVLAVLQPEPPTLRVMDSVAWHGEVWTDGRGFATVRVPSQADLHPPLDYELRDLDPATSARVTAELEDGRFTIATDRPHVKVAWRISRRKEEPR